MHTTRLRPDATWAGIKPVFKLAFNPSDLPNLSTFKPFNFKPFNLSTLSAGFTRPIFFRIQMNPVKEVFVPSWLKTLAPACMIAHTRACRIVYIYSAGNHGA